MFLTHSFARPESLSRALTFLAQLGFSPTQIEIRNDGAPRISLNFIDTIQAAAARALFNAVDSTDPDGPLGYYDLSRLAMRTERQVEAPAEASSPPAFSRSVIHFEFDREPLPPEVDWSNRRDPLRLM